MPRFESFRPPTATRLERERRDDGRLLRLQPFAEVTEWDSAAHLRAFREYEASRLLLAELGRRHGPLD